MRSHVDAVSEQSPREILRNEIIPSLRKVGHEVFYGTFTRSPFFELAEDLRIRLSAIDQILPILNSVINATLPKQQREIAKSIPEATEREIIHDLAIEAKVILEIAGKHHPRYKEEVQKIEDMLTKLIARVAPGQIPSL